MHVVDLKTERWQQAVVSLIHFESQVFNQKSCRVCLWSIDDFKHQNGQNILLCDGLCYSIFNISNNNFYVRNSLGKCSSISKFSSPYGKYNTFKVATCRMELL